MSKNDLHPPLTGPGRNPILHGVANGLAKLFPPVEQPKAHGREPARRDAARPNRD